MLTITLLENAKNIFEYRLNDLNSLQGKIEKTLGLFGLYKVREYYDNEDLIAPSYLKHLVFSDNSNNEITITIPATYNFVLDGNIYAPIFQVLDKKVFRKSDGVYVSNSYMRWMLTVDLSYVIYRNKLRIPALLYLIDIDDSIENVIDKLKTDKIKIIESEIRPLNYFGSLKIDNNKWLVLESETNTNIDALFKPFVPEIKHKQFFNKIDDTTYAERKFVATFSNRKTILDTVRSIARTPDFISNQNNGTTFLDILYELYNMDTLPNLVEVNNFGERRLRLSEWVLDDFVQQIIQKYILKNSKVKLYSNVIKRFLLKDSRKTLLTPINPIDELATYSRCSYIGRGGIDRDSITVSMRNIHSSYYGNIDPIDTPAGKKIGVSQYIVPTANIDKTGSFGKHDNADKILSVTTSLIPFLQYNDSIRVQMAASQIRQAVALEDPDIPLITSGTESHYLRYTSMIKIARDNGEIVYSDDQITLIYYPELKEFDLIDTSIKESDGFDITLKLTDHVKKNKSKRIKKDHILAKTNHISENGVLKLGKNLLTGFISYGWNFEDAVVVSESAAEKMRIKYITHERHVIDGILLSLKENEYTPLLPDGTNVQKGQVILKYTNQHQTTIADILSNESVIRAPANGKIYYKVVALKNKFDYLPMVNWVNKYTETNQSRIKLIKDIIDEYETEPSHKEYLMMLLHQMSQRKKYTQSIIVDYYIVQTVPLKVGSKLANRHGNKGVISIIIPDDKMPFVPRLNKHLDVILNPLGVISRMNIGQLFELHLTNALTTYLNKINNIKNDDEYFDKVFEFLITVDNTKDHKIAALYDSLKNDINKKHALAKYIRNNGVSLLQPSFESCTLEQLQRAMAMAGIGFTEQVIVPNLYNNTNIEIDAAIGYNYFMRLVHEPYKKIFGRSIGAYGKFEQPSSGSNAHRLGEMEVWTLLSYDTPSLIKEFLSIKADNPNERYELFNMLYHAGSAEYYDFSSLETESSVILTQWLKVCGIDIKF